MTDRPVGQSSGGTARGIGALLTALLAACAAFQLNASMLNPALVTMGRELGVSDAAVGLSQTAFFTAAALFSLFLPRYSDIVGRKRLLVIMLAVMTVGTVMAALAPNIELMYLARVVQGVCGPVIPMCLLILRSQITDAKRYGTAMGLVAAVTGGIAGIDTLLGGWLATTFGFRSIFWVTAAIAVVAVVLVLVWAPESAPSAGQSMDWAGAATLVVSIAAALIALNEAGKLADANWLLVIGLLVLAVASFAAFWAVEGRRTDPLISTADLSQRASWAVIATTVLTLTGVFAAVNGVIMSLAQNEAAGFGLAADVASLIILTPYALIGWVVGPFAGRLAPTMGYRKVLRIGLAGSVVVLLVMALAGVHSLALTIALALAIGVTYAGVANIMLNGLGVALAPKHNPGSLPGLNAGAFNLGAGLSFAVLPAVQVVGSPQGSSSVAGYVSSLLVAVVITGLALAVSLLIPRPVDAEIGRARRGVAETGSAA